jgi:hypothetical protein
MMTMAGERGGEATARRRCLACSCSKGGARRRRGDVEAPVVKAIFVCLLWHLREAKVHLLHFLYSFHHIIWILVCLLDVALDVFYPSDLLNFAGSLDAPTSISLLNNTKHCDPPRPPLSTCSCSSNHLSYTTDGQCGRVVRPTGGSCPCETPLLE